MDSIVLTGASRGLGKALHDLILTDYSAAQLISISRSPVQAPSERATYLSADFSQAPALEFEIAEGVRRLVFINNAGSIEPIVTSMHLASDELMMALMVNCIAPLSVARSLAEVAHARGITLLVLNISSGAAKRPIPGWTAYCTSKASMAMALDCLAAENPWVSVTHFDPGVIDTEMQARIRSSRPLDMPGVQCFIDLQRDNRLRSAADVANDVLSMIRAL